MSTPDKNVETSDGAVPPAPSASHLKARFQQWFFWLTLAAVLLFLANLFQFVDLFHLTEKSDSAMKACQALKDAGLPSDAHSGKGPCGDALQFYIQRVGLGLVVCLMAIVNARMGQRQR